MNKKQTVTENTSTVPPAYASDDSAFNGIAALLTSPPVRDDVGVIAMGTGFDKVYATFFDKGRVAAEAWLAKSSIAEIERALKQVVTLNAAMNAYKFGFHSVLTLRGAELVYVDAMSNVEGET